ncbi:rhodanese-like domain-containing protein [Desulfovulcanus sp.]
MKSKIFVFILLLLLVSVAASFATVDFPGRREAKYKNVQSIEIDDLYKEYTNNNITLVDVRSQLEFDTIHPKGALHIPVAEKGFEGKIKNSPAVRKAKK